MTIPKLKTPSGACDAHMHFYDQNVPAAPGGPALPGNFTVPMYRELQRQLGLQRVIVVQPNAYRADNRVTLDSIRALAPNAKGVGVVTPQVSDAEIERLTQGGIVAQRFFQLPNGSVGFDKMDQIMARVHPFGWHAKPPARRPRAASVRGADQTAAGQIRDRSRGKIPGAGAAGARSIRSAAAPGRHRTLLD